MKIAIDWYYRLVLNNNSWYQLAFVYLSLFLLCIIIITFIVIIIKSNDAGPSIGNPNVYELHSQA